MARALRQDYSSRHRRFLTVRIFILGLLLTCLPVAAARAASYTFTTVEVPGSEGTSALGINTAGQIVGGFVDVIPGLPTGTYGFLKDGTTFTVIDVPGATATSAYGINAAGQIVGYFTDRTGTHGFVKDDATFTTIDVPGADGTVAWGINAAGQIVGFFWNTADPAGVHHGFLKDGATFTIIDVPGATHTQAHGINTAGQIVGYFTDATGYHHGFLKDGATFTIIDVPGADVTLVWGIDTADQIVGWFADATTRYHGFVKDGATFTIIDVPGATYTFPYGINTGGQIVGLFTDDTSSQNHSFVATPDAVDTVPPVITVSATPETLWPPNGRTVSVTIVATITDAGSGVDPNTTIYAVEDEYGSVEPSGSLTLEADGRYTATIGLEAARRGNDADGRRYTITVSAQDNEGNEGVDTAIVTVPQNQGQGQGIAAR